MDERLTLSKRLLTIANNIDQTKKFADIGSDHAYLPCYICLQSKQAKAIAGEVALGPYKSAKATVDMFGLEQCVEVKLGDGLSVIDAQTEQIVIAGMGGSLISSIMESDEHKLQHVQRMILQPNNNAYRVRKTLIKQQFTLINEIIMEENNHIYEILIAEKNNVAQPYNQATEKEKQLLFGPFLMQEKNEAFRKKWTMEKNKLMNVLHSMSFATEKDKPKIDKIERKLQWIEEVLI